MQYYNDTNIITIDQIIDAMTTHKPVVNPDVLAKALDHTVIIDTTNDYLYKVKSVTGEYYSVNVATMVCNCPAGEHNQTCSHALAAAKRHIHLMDGFRVNMTIEQYDGQPEMIFS